MGMRWRVAIVDDHERSRAALRGAIWAAGGGGVGGAGRWADAVPLTPSAAPARAGFARGAPGGDGGGAPAPATPTTARPVVLFTSHTDAALVERARAAGV